MCSILYMFTSNPTHDITPRSSCSPPCHYSLTITQLAVHFVSMPRNPSLNHLQTFIANPPSNCYCQFLLIPAVAIELKESLDNLDVVGGDVVVSAQHAKVILRGLRRYWYSLELWLDIRLFTHFHLVHLLGITILTRSSRSRHTFVPVKSVSVVFFHTVRRDFSTGRLLTTLDVV